MKAFVSWSGGKDCSFALYKHMEQNPQTQIVTLLNMNRIETQNAHRVTEELLDAQAAAMGYTLTRETVDAEKEYAYSFQKAINKLKEEYGVEYGIFGDLYLEPHLTWIREQCALLGITPIFPLLNIDVHDLYKEFVAVGFKSKVVAVKLTHPLQSLLGQDLNMENYEEMIRIEGFDVCGENGEFHSFVYDGPTFKEAVKLVVTSEYTSAKHHGYYLDVEKK